VPRQNEIKATLSRCFPDARVMGAQHTHMAFRQEGRLRPRKDDFTATAKKMRAGCMNPLAVPRDDGGFHAIDADILVVIAADRKYRRDLAKLANKATQRSQFAGRIDQVAAQKQSIDLPTADCVDHLTAKKIGPLRAQVNVADIQQSAGSRPAYQTLFTDMKWAVLAEGERSGDQDPPPFSHRKGAFEKSVAKQRKQKKKRSVGESLLESEWGSAHRTWAGRKSQPAIKLLLGNHQERPKPHLLTL
jgi:hypothetical protein